MNALTWTDTATDTRPTLDDLPGTTLETVLGQAALQTRVDRKYLLAADELPGVLGGVDGGLAVLRIGERQGFGYHSTYFDTPDLEAFRLAGQGRRRRFKVRTRVYRDSGDAWLEVKTRGQRGATVKDRTPYELADAGRLTPAARAFVARTLDERGVDGVDVAELVPALHTSYVRTTLLLTDPGATSRATVDTGLVWRRPWTETALSVPDQVIVETKGGTVPSSLDRALWRAGFRPGRISKYGAGLAALDDDLPSLKWHRLLNQRLQTDPGSSPG